MASAAASTGEPSAAAPPALTGKLASAASIAGPFQKAIADAVEARKAQGKEVPKLVGILATPSPPSVAYAQWTKKACEQVGIQFEIWQTWSDDDVQKRDEDAMEGVEGGQANKLPTTDVEANVEDLIIAANADDSVHGIMVYYPIFGGRQDTYLQQIVDPRKDVEGLHFSYCFNMYHNIRWIAPAQLGGAPGTTIEASAESGENALPPPGFAKSILPCTPLAVVKCLESMGAYDKSLPYGDCLSGKTITVINRSEVVGRPLAALLSNDGAKVYSVDVDSVQEFNKRAEHDNTYKPSKIVMLARQRNAAHRLRPHHIVRQCSMSLDDCLAASDIVISGVPSPKFKINTSQIKQGALTINFSSEKNFEKDVRARAAIHLPAIGKTTIAMLQRNLLRLVEYREMVGPPTAPSNAPGRYTNGDGGAGNAPNGHNGVNDGHANGQGGSGSSASNNNGPTNGPSFQGKSNSSGPEETKDAVDANEYRRPSTAGPLPTPPTWPRANLPPLQRFVSQPRERSMIAPSASPRSQFRRVSQAGQAPSASAWEWRSPAARNDSIVSAYTPTTTCFPASQVPGGPNAPQSPLLFAPIGSGHSGNYGSGYPQGPGNQSNVSFHSASSPRSATPVSPLIIDNLTVEDSSSSAQPASAGSQRQSWDSGPPRTPRDGSDTSLPHPAPSSQFKTLETSSVPSVLSRPRTGEANATAGAPQQQQSQMPGSTGQSFAHVPPSPMPFSPTDEKMMVDHDHSGITPAMRTHTLQQESPEQRAGDQPLISQQPAASSGVQTNRIFSQDRLAHSRRRRRPPFSYSSLIAQAIASAPDGRMTLREIYTWISNAYPDLYSMEGAEGSGWQNTVRHNLSLNKAFIKVARTAQDIYDSCSSGVPSMSQQARGKGGWWMLDPNVNPATIGAATKDGMDEETDSMRTQSRRRRNDSMAAGSVMSEDDMMSPITATYPLRPGHPAHSASFSAASTPAPSVLQLGGGRGRSQTMSTASPNSDNGGLPSVLQASQTPRMTERPIYEADEDANARGQPPSAVHSGPIGARLIAGRTRPRGYTTNSTDMSSRQGISPYYSPHAPASQPFDHHHHPVPPSPFSQAAPLPSPGAPPLSPYTPSHGHAPLPPPSSRFAVLHSPAMNGGAALPYPTVNSPQKRKLRFEPGEEGQQQQPPAGSPAFYPRSASVAEEGGVRQSPSYVAQSLQPPGPAQGRANRIAPSPLSGRATLAGSTTSKLDLLRRQSSIDDIRRRPSVAPLSHRSTSGTVVSLEQDEANGSRMSITGLLNA